MLSTLELYGVDPKELADMRYEDALYLMRDKIWERKRNLADELYQCTDGITASRIQHDITRAMKAIELTDLRIEEIAG